MIIECKLLLAMRGIVGVVDIKDNGGGRLGVAGDAVVHPGACEPIEGFAVHLMRQPGKGGSTRKVVLGLQGTPLYPQFEHRVMAEMIGVIGIGIARGDLINALSQQVPQGMINRGLMPFVVDSGGEAFREANLAVDTTEQERAKVGGQGAARKICTEGLASDGRKTQLFWVRIAHKPTSCGFYGMDGSHLPFYQRLTRGLCFLVKNPG